MDLKPWDPWDELHRVEKEMDDLIAAVLDKLRRVVPGKPIAFVPRMDIIESEGGYTLYLVIPGMVEEDLDITLAGEELIIRGEREPLFDLERVTIHQRQWKHGYFERRVRFPEKVDEASIRATYDAGVLTIRIPRCGGAAGPGADDGGGDEPRSPES